MTETARIPDADEKEGLYARADERITGLLHGEGDPIVVMASIAAVLHDMMPHYFWTGFYRVSGDGLVIGPYQGPPACLRIGMGKGVCGTAWQTGESVIVEDVHSFPGHIACDSRSASEIVVPWKNLIGEVTAVLDVDSTLPAAFDAVDEQALRGILDRVAVPCPGRPGDPPDWALS